MPAATPEQIHRLFQDSFNAGDLDSLMELYEPDAALIAQPGSIAHGSEQARAALQGFLALKGRIRLDTKLGSHRRRPGLSGQRLVAERHRAGR
jgi:ketosteroid isomerase-like protein